MHTEDNFVDRVCSIFEYGQQLSLLLNQTSSD